MVDILFLNKGGDDVEEMIDAIWLKTDDGKWIRQHYYRKQTKTVSQDDIDMFNHIVFNNYECIVDKIVVKENNQDITLNDLQIADGTLFKYIKNSCIIKESNIGTVYIEK